MRRVRLAWNLSSCNMFFYIFKKKTCSVAFRTLLNQNGQYQMQTLSTATSVFAHFWGMQFSLNDRHHHIHTVSRKRFYQQASLYSSSQIPTYRINYTTELWKNLPPCSVRQDYSSAEALYDGVCYMPECLVSSGFGAYKKSAAILLKLRWTYGKEP